MVLRWLSELNERDGGYELRGVRGWARVADISDRLRQRLNDELPRLTARGLLDRENIALPGRELGLWLYRITARGSEVIAAAQPVAVSPPEEKPPARMIFTEPQWSALQYMRAARTQTSPARFVTRELGWRTPPEIREGASVRSRNVQVWPDDVYMLERNDLLDKRQEIGVGRSRPLTFYRITALGEHVVRLEWNNPASPADSGAA
jgi:hypothetical protein